MTRSRISVREQKMESDMSNYLNCRKLTDMIDNPQNRSSLYLYISAQAALQPQNMPDYGTLKTRNTRLTQRNNKGKRIFYSLGVFTWHRGDFRPGASSLRFPLKALYLFTWYHHKMSFRRESPRREFTPVLVPGRKFHSGTKSRSGIM